MAKHWSDALVRIHACKDAVEYAKTKSSFAKAWNDCSRGDWMLWLAGKQCKTVANRKVLVLAACECARLALSFVRKNELRPLHAIETAEAWAHSEKGIITLKQVRNAAAYAAADAAKKDTLVQCAKIVRKYYQPNGKGLRLVAIKESK